MSAVATPNQLHRAVAFYEAPIGKKVIVAITGIVLFGFVLGHMAGNLQIFLPPREDGVYRLDHYAELLRANMGLLWAVRLVLLASVVVHIIATIQLKAMALRARPEGYARYTATKSTFASRTMMWTGPMIAAFVIYHILHFTTGQAHPEFEPGAVHRNLILGFQNIFASAAYIVAMVLLGFHLQHGLWSMFQSMGINHPRYNPVFKRFAIAFSVIIVLGNISIPAAVLLGLVE
jgi:succinate dehydrogenase / fumarate reductase cytochrome b subunit